MTPMQKVDVLRAACCVAGADGSMDEKERTLIDRLAKEVGVGKASLTAMMERACNDKKFHTEQFAILRENPQQCMVTVLEVAMADGVLTDDEQHVLQTLAKNLEVPDDVYQGLMAKVSEMM